MPGVALQIIDQDEDRLRRMSGRFEDPDPHLAELEDVPSFTGRYGPIVPARDPM